MNSRPYSRANFGHATDTKAPLAAPRHHPPTRGKPTPTRSAEALPLYTLDSAGDVEATRGEALEMSPGAIPRAVVVDDWNHRVMC